MNAPSPTMVPDNFEEIKWTELEKSLSDLRLKWITIGDYVVVVNNKCDVTIGGEPYLALQVWFNVKSGKMIHRIWDQTVSYSKVTGVSQFVEACSSYFKEGLVLACLYLLMKSAGKRMSSHRLQCQEKYP